MLRCIPFYEALAHHGIPLLSHTGWEHVLPCLDRSVADPMLLLEALKRGVKVIAAHCGTRLFPWEIDYFPTGRNWRRNTSTFTATPRRSTCRTDGMRMT